MTLDSTADDPEPPSAQDVVPYNSHLSASFIPSTTQRMTEQDTVWQSVQERDSLINSESVPLQCYGLPAVQHPSMSSAQRATCHVPSPLCSQLVLLILYHLLTAKLAIVYSRIWRPYLPKSSEDQPWCVRRLGMVVVARRSISHALTAIRFFVCSLISAVQAKTIGRSEEKLWAYTYLRFCWGWP